MLKQRVRAHPLVVSSLTGSAKALRIDGNEFNLSNGDPISRRYNSSFKKGAVGLVFLDKTTLSLSEGGKMVLDELVYDPHGNREYGCGYG